MVTKSNIKLVLTASLAVCSLTMGAPHALCQPAEQVIPLPAAMQSLAGQYLKADQTPASASDVMDQMASQMTPDLVKQLEPMEGSNIQAKLALIAWDRQQHPEIYQEIDRRYLRSIRNPSARALVAPDVSAEYATEKYRLAWEYLLLTPVSGHPSGLWQSRCLEAITEIKNSASLLTLRQALALTTAPGTRSDYNRNWQQELLDFMSDWHDSQSLQAILDSMILIQQQQAKAVKGEETWDVAKDVREMIIAPMYHPDENAKWRDIIEAFPKAGLTASQNEFLTSVLTAIDTNPPYPPGMTPELIKRLNQH